MRDCLEKAWAIQEETVAHRRYLHERAEVGFDTPLTMDYIDKTLKGTAIDLNDCQKAG